MIRSEDADDLEEGAVRAFVAIERVALEDLLKFLRVVSGRPPVPFKEQLQAFRIESNELCIQDALVRADRHLVWPRVDTVDAVDEGRADNVAGAIELLDLAGAEVVAEAELVVIDECHPAPAEDEEAEEGDEDRNADQFGKEDEFVFGGFICELFTVV